MNDRTMNTGVPCMVLRGGSSKGAYFVASDLPTDSDERNELLLAIMGSPDDRQIDGIGGAHPLTSKVAIVERSNREDCDVEYLFLQVGVGDGLVTDRQNCGNLLAGVGPFAIERGLVQVPKDLTSHQLRILMRNTDSIVTATLTVEDGQPVYAGQTAISGVPGTASSIRLDFEDVAGGSCGALLPTGNVVDAIDGVDCTLIDAGMPVVVLRADELGINGDESPTELEANEELRTRLEDIRLAAGHLMNLGDVSTTTVPKLSLVSSPRTEDGALCTRTFIPHRCHEAIGVLGAVSVAVAALLPGSVAKDSVAQDLVAQGSVAQDSVAQGSVAQDLAAAATSVLLEHPTGTFEAVIELGANSQLERAGIIRTARKLLDGTVYPREY